MATYTDIHQSWSKGYASYVYEPIFNVYANGAWSKPWGRIYSGGAWRDVYAYSNTLTEPKFLIRRNGLWVSLNIDVLEIEVCGGGWTAGTSYTNSWTIPSSIFNKNVAKFVVSHYTLYTKQYGGGTNFTHSFRKNSNAIASISGGRDDGYTCSDNNWSYAMSGNSGTIFYPGDVLDVYVFVPDTFGYDYGGTKVSFRGVWYFI